MPRRRKPEEHENLERWLVSYADFITLLFAFFVVMYAISSVNEGKYRVLSESLVSAFRNTPSNAQPLHVSPTPQSGGVIRNQMPVRRSEAGEDLRRRQQERMKNVAQDILQVLAPLVKEGHVKVTQSNRGVAVEINASVLFQPGLAALESASIKALTAVGQVLAKVDYPIQVEGHTDVTPIRTPTYPSNWELSAARASSVVRLFVDQGVGPQRLVAVGYGETQPLAGNDTPDGRSRNRRVTVMILAEEQKKITEIPIVSAAKER